MHHFLCRRATAVALGLPLLAAAQGRSDAADPGAPTSGLIHSSAFADYKPYRDVAPGDWRLLNDTVGRAALKPAAKTPDTAPPSSAAAASAPSTKMPMPNMPGHHHHPKGGRQ